MDSSRDALNALYGKLTPGWDEFPTLAGILDGLPRGTALSGGEWVRYRRLGVPEYIPTGDVSPIRLPGV